MPDPGLLETNTIKAAYISRLQKPSRHLNTHLLPSSPILHNCSCTMLTSQATSLILLLLAGSSHAVQICCSSFADNTCTKDQYERHRQNIILNQMINYRGENCQRKGAGPGAWTDKKNWSEYYECEVWNGFQHQIEAGDCTLFCTTTNGIDYKPCI